MSINNSPLLLTGASGFAGSHMLKQLLSNNNYHIYCPVTYEHGGRVERIPALIGEEFKDRFSTFQFDLAKDDFNDLDFLQDVETIINFASESHVDRSIVNPRNFVSNNIELMINLLEFARLSGKLKKVIHISTDEVFGSIEENMTNYEWEIPHKPSNPYSASKSAQESLAYSYAKTYDLEISIVNVTNMFGEGQNQEKFIPKIIRKIISDEEINIDTDQSGKIGGRKYVYVGDVAKAIWQILESDFRNMGKENLAVRKFHVSGDRHISNKDVVETISRILNKQFKFNVSPSPRNGYDVSYQLNSDLIRNLGWRETKAFEDRMHDVVKWTLEHPDWLNIDYKKD